METLTKTRKRCSGPCGKLRAISKFRLLVSGYHQGMCRDCERQYERERWHTRTDASKHRSGGAAHQRRRRAHAAVAA